MASAMIVAGHLPTRAQEPAYSLPQVIRYALRSNGELKAFREERGIREAGQEKAAVLPNPTLDFEGATGAATGSGAENSLAIGISQEFLLAGKREKRLAVARTELESYRWQVAEKERLLREEVQGAFLDVVLARERVALADRSIELARQLLEVTRERLAAGDIPELEMNLVKVEVARSEAGKIEAATALLQSETKLRSLMGAPPGEAPAIAGRLDAELLMTKTVAELRQLAREQRPDLKVLEAERSRGEAGIVLARAEAVPNVTAGIVLRRDATAMEVGTVEGKDTAYTVGVRLSIPIPVFDKNKGGIREARARRDVSEGLLAASLRNVDRDVETAYASFQSAVKVLSLYRADIIPQLAENLGLTREAYRLGEVGILSVIQEQKKFVEVSDGYLTALCDRRKAMARLEAATASELSGGNE